MELRKDTYKRSPKGVSSPAKRTVADAEKEERKEHDEDPKDGK